MAHKIFDKAADEMQKHHKHRSKVHKRMHHVAQLHHDGDISNTQMDGAVAMAHDDLTQPMGMGAMPTMGSTVARIRRRSEHPK